MGRLFFVYVIHEPLSSQKPQIDSFKATKDDTTRTIKNSKLSGTAGSIFVTVTNPNYSESAVTKVSFNAEKLPTLATKDVKISNNIGNDKIVLKGLTKDVTYTIYKDAKLKDELTSFKANGSSKTLTVKQVGAKKGTIYIVASKKGYLSSDTTKVTFKAQPTVGLPAKNVKITNAKKQDKIKLTGLKKGMKYVIYKDAKKKKVLTSFTAKSSTKTIKVSQLGKKAGKLYITAKAPDYEESAITTVSFSKQK